MNAELWSQGKKSQFWPQKEDGKQWKDIFIRFQTEINQVRIHSWKGCSSLFLFGFSKLALRTIDKVNIFIVEGFNKKRIVKVWFIGASSLVNGRSVLIALRPLSHDCLRFLVQNCVINEKLDLVGKFELSLRTRSQMAALQNPPALTQKDPGNDYLESVFLNFLMITSMERREILKIHEVIIGNCLRETLFLLALIVKMEILRHLLVRSNPSAWTHGEKSFI